MGYMLFVILINTDAHYSVVYWLAQLSCQMGFSISGVIVKYFGIIIEINTGKEVIV